MVSFSLLQDEACGVTLACVLPRSAPYSLILCHTAICSKWCGFLNMLAGGSLLPFKLLLPKLHVSDERRATVLEGFIAQGLWGSPCTQAPVPEMVHFTLSHTSVLQEWVQEAWAPEECSSQDPAPNTHQAAFIPHSDFTKPLKVFQESITKGPVAGGWARVWNEAGGQLGMHASAAGCPCVIKAPHPRRVLLTAELSVEFLIMVLSTPGHGF